jgi:c-di-GMP-binding flagellar brake protein YcgR
MKTPQPILDRRRSARVDEELYFKIKHQIYEAQAKTVNISAHGALCLVEKNIPLMTRVDVALMLPALNGKTKRPKSLRIRGVVVRREKTPSSAGFLLALYFSQISPRDRESLVQFVESRMTHR